MKNKNEFSYDDLLKCGHGKLFGPGNAQLPLPPMLMFDRITSISESGGSYDRGKIVAEMDVKSSHWFFSCHFEGDPVMPGCLGLDALWQLTGFFLGWTGDPGKGRALGLGNLKFNNQVTPEAKLITYQIDIKRIVRRGFSIAIADGTLIVDQNVAYEAKDLRVGLFIDSKD
ncbi:MAG: 3-hydroxyacyl-[acyl-carrier-protein] dehydratase FabA [Rhodospirillaceae bacterium]|nr:3-hydroxyacyl-[acyl-carrier-protein] dehydratase FabA [Rhodospirillaceae bacterium]